MFAARNNFLTPASVGGSYTLGLSDSLLTLTGQDTSWTEKTIDISSYAGATVRLVFYHYGTYFTGDMQLDDINIDGTTYTFESDATGWETTTTNSNTIVTTTASDTYNAITFSSVATIGSSARWNRDLGGTSSASTGLTTDHTLGTTSGYYLYAETSSPYPCGYWLRSPEVTLSGSPTLSFWEARYGATMGDCEVYLDVIS